MFVQATISCKCGCIFESELQKSTVDFPPKCPQCGQVMDKTSWESLRDVMFRLSDVNHHIVKWHLERNEPLMQIPAVTVRTLKD